MYTHNLFDCDFTYDNLDLKKQNKIVNLPALTEDFEFRSLSKRFEGTLNKVRAAQKISKFRKGGLHLKDFDLFA